MTGDRSDYIRYRMQRATETLREAEHLFGGGFTAGATNRAYYACFYAVSALLAAEGYSSSKHSGVMSLFDQYWIKPGRMPEEVGAFYHLIFQRRQRGDYEYEGPFECEDVAKWLAEARSFVERAADWLRNSGIEV